MSTHATQADKSDRFRIARILTGADSLTATQRQMIAAEGDLATLPFSVATALRAREEFGVARLGADQTGAVHYLDTRGKTVTVRVERGGHQVSERDLSTDDNDDLPTWVAFVAEERGWADDAPALEVLD